MRSAIEKVLKKSPYFSISLIEEGRYAFFPLKITRQTVVGKKNPKNKKVEKTEDGYVMMDSSHRLLRSYSGGVYEVYKGYFVDLKTKQPLTKKPLAVKKIKKAEFDQHKKELIDADINNSTMSTAIIEQNDDVYLIMEYLPGTNLIDEKGQPAPEIKNLSLSDRAAFILEVVVKFYNIKGDEQNFKNNVYEFLTITILNLLGAKDPLFYKRQGSQNYNFDGLFDGVDVPEEPINIKTRVSDFLHRMEAPQSEYRPDAREILSFATTFDSFCKTLEMPYTDTFVDYCERVTRLSEPAAKLELLAQGVWNADLSDRAVKIPSNNMQPSIPQNVKEVKNKVIDRSNQNNIKSIPAPTFEQYNFLHNPLFNKIVLVLRDKEIFDKNIIVKLSKASTTQELPVLYNVMQKLNNKSLLTKEILLEIVQNLDLCEKILESSPLFVFGLAIKTGIPHRAWDYFGKPTLQEKLELFKNVLFRKEDLCSVFGAQRYKDIYKLIADSLIKEIEQYQKTLMSRNSSILFSGVCFWRSNSFNRYTFKEEIEVYEALKQAITEGDFNEFNKQSHNIDVLKKGIMPTNFRKSIEGYADLTSSVSSVFASRPSIDQYIF